MNWGKWKIPVIGWASVAIALWALLYGFYWHDRTSHKFFWGDALVNWIGDLVMLHWVKGYQPLIGGVLTLLAGAGVLLAAKMQLDHQRASTAEQRREAMATQIVADRAILGTVRIIFGVARQGFIENEASAGLEAIKRLAAYEKELHRIHPILAEVIFLAARQAERGLVQCGTSHEPNSPEWKRVRRGHAYAVLLHYFLMPSFVRFDESGNFIFAKKSIEDVQPVVAKHSGITNLNELHWAAGALVAGID